MLVSIASFLPIIIVGPFSDLVGTTVVILAVAIGGEAARIAGELLRALFGGAAQLYFIAILAAIHRQLSGLSGATTAADTFS